MQIASQFWSKEMFNGDGASNLDDSMTQPKVQKIKKAAWLKRGSNEAIWENAFELTH